MTQRSLGEDEVARETLDETGEHALLAQDDGKTHIYLMISRKWTNWMMTLIVLMFVLTCTLALVFFLSYRDSKAEIKDLERQIQQQEKGNDQ